jgi:hypothetical protein
LVNGVSLRRAVGPDTEVFQTLEESLMKVYMGILLRVDLTTGEVTKEALDPKQARDYTGAHEEVPPETDPLGPDAKLYLMTGPVTATNLGGGGLCEPYQEGNVHVSLS